MNEIQFREARPTDAVAIGAVHVVSWRESYAGLLPAEMLSNLSADQRAAMWAGVLADPAALGGTAIFVAEQGDAIVGFGSCCGQRDGALKSRGFGGEIGSIYVLQSHQRRGVGRTLISLMARRLLDQQYSAATLWVLRDNARARAVYDRLGGTLVSEREATYPHAILAEIAYGWRDLRPLIGQG